MGDTHFQQDGYSGSIFEVLRLARIVHFPATELITENSPYYPD